MSLPLELFVNNLKIIHEALYKMGHLEDPYMFKELFWTTVSLLSGYKQENYDLIRDFLIRNEDFNEYEAVLIYTYMITGASPTEH